MQSDVHLHLGILLTSMTKAYKVSIQSCSVTIPPKPSKSFRLVWKVEYAFHALINRSPATNTYYYLGCTTTNTNCSAKLDGIQACAFCLIVELCVDLIPSQINLNFVHARVFLGGAIIVCQHTLYYLLMNQ